jgi:heptosyltransferase-2
VPRALILKFGAIGDVVMAIPAAHALYLRGYTIDWLTSETAAPILHLYPWINVLTIDERQLIEGSKLRSLRATLKLWRRFFLARYDLCATLYYDTRYKLLTFPIRARRKVLLSRTDRATMLLPGRHHTDEYARILLAHTYNVQRTTYNPPTSITDDETPYQLSPIPAQNLPPNPIPFTLKPRIVLIPAGARNLMRDDALRRWPIENYVALATALLARNYEVILSGGPTDTWATPHFAGLPVTNVIGQHTLLETLALFDSATVTITHDTGPLHLAGLTHTAILTIFGPTDPHGRLPQRHNCVALWGGEGFACRPCYDGRNYAPCHNNGCIQQITPAMALAETEVLLTAIRENKPLLPRIRVPKHTSIQITSANSAH